MYSDMDSADTGSNISRASSSLDSDEEKSFSEYILSDNGKSALDAENANILKIYDTINRNKLRILRRKLYNNNTNNSDAGGDEIQSRYVDLEIGNKVTKSPNKFELEESSDSVDSDLSSSDSDVEVILEPMLPEWIKWTMLSNFSKEYFKISIPSGMNELLDYYGVYTLEAPSTFLGTIVRATIRGIFFSATGITNSIVSLTKWISLLILRRNRGELKL